MRFCGRKRPSMELWGHGGWHRGDVSAVGWRHGRPLGTARHGDPSGSVGTSGSRHPVGTLIPWGTPHPSAPLPQTPPAAPHPSSHRPHPTSQYLHGLVSPCPQDVPMSPQASISPHPHDVPGPSHPHTAVFPCPHTSIPPPSCAPMSLILISPRPHVPLSPYPHASMLWCLHVPISPRPHIPVSPPSP